jgi:hypothetical protein
MLSLNAVLRPGRADSWLDGAAGKDIQEQAAEDMLDFGDETIRRAFFSDMRRRWASASLPKRRNRGRTTKSFADGSRCRRGPD